MNNDIFEKLKAIAVNDIGIDADKVKPESDIIKELGLDSLDIVDMLMKVEETFGVRTLRHDGRGSAPAFRRQAALRPNAKRMRAFVLVGLLPQPKIRDFRPGPRHSLRSARKRAHRAASLRARFHRTCRRKRGMCPRGAAP